MFVDLPAWHERREAAAAAYFEALDRLTLLQLRIMGEAVAAAFPTATRIVCGWDNDDSTEHLSITCVEAADDAELAVGGDWDLWEDAQCAAADLMPANSHTWEAFGQMTGTNETRWSFEVATLRAIDADASR